MAVRDAGTRQDTFVIRVHVNGENWGVWDRKSGGEIDSDELKYYPGGMAAPTSLGGRRTTGNVTLSRLYDRHDDHDRVQKLYNAVGRGKVDIGIRPMDIDGNEYGRTTHYTGTLKRCTPPDVDSSSSTEAMIELEVTTNGFPTVA